MTIVGQKVWLVWHGTYSYDGDSEYVESIHATEASAIAKRDLLRPDDATWREPEAEAQREGFWNWGDGITMSNPAHEVWVAEYTIES